jgi:UDP-N-acetylglucosamine 2-epimerase (non-hydrolysing)
MSAYPRVLHVFGARPNFVKMAPVIAALEQRGGVQNVLAHTGQHYDHRMSSEVLGDLGVPEPDHFLGVGSGSHGAQTGKALAACEQLITELGPDLVVVAGDVNSTLAGALAAAKLGVAIAHVEAGLRSFDWTMPEEINRVLTDRLSDLLFTTSPEAEDHLRREGIDVDRVHFVGNTMIDSLRRFQASAEDRAYWNRLGVGRGTYVLVTLHRPSNVDADTQLAAIVDELVALARRFPVVFPVHPRTRARLEASGGLASLAAAGAFCTEPTGYLDFLSLEIGAGAIVTDSGGIQEEAAALGVPCYTLRANTERPITVTHGSNTLLGDDPVALRKVELAEAGMRAATSIPLWDGHAGARIAQTIGAYLDQHGSVGV